MNHPTWIIKYVHKSKINAVKIADWETHHEIATIPDVYQFNGQESHGAKAARLIAVAPELLTALEAAVLHIERMNLTATEAASTPQSELDYMNAAIAKAKG